MQTRDPFVLLALAEILGAHDFVEELVREGEETGLFLGKKRANIRVDELSHHTYAFVIDCLRAIRP